MDDAIEAAAVAILEGIRKRAMATTAADQLRILAEAYALIVSAGAKRLDSE